MASYFYITLGPLKGSRIRLRENLTLGREAANINLRDPKVSNIHAQISRNSTGSWYIRDMRSRNGISHEGKKCQHLVLKEGMSILIGDNTFILKERKKKTNKKSPNKASTQSIWQKKLLEFCNEIAPKVKNQPSEMIPFDPPLLLKILQGIQAKTEWYMGYGPRKVGMSSLDFKLFEGELPDYSFEVRPTKEGPFFETQHPRIVRLNGHSVSSEKLNSGDVISINETQIQINFLR